MSASKYPNVNQKHGSWYLVKGNKWTRLCRVAEGDGALFAALSRINSQTPTVLRQVFPLYLEQAEIAETTRDKYRQVLTGIIDHYFGDAPPNSVTQSHIAQFLEMRKQQGAGTTGNRERAALSSVFAYAMRKGWAATNPCQGVRRNKERPSTRYVETSELEATYGRASGALKLLLNAAYLSGMRLTDMMSLRREQVTTEGIEWVESKTGKRNLMGWQPDLRQVIDRAIAHGDEHATKITKKLPIERPLPSHVFINNRGWPWTQYGVSSAMRRAGATFGIRHLRSKAQTDSSGNVLGHTGQMRERYTKVRKLTALG